MNLRTVVCAHKVGDEVCQKSIKSMCSMDHVSHPCWPSCCTHCLKRESSRAFVSNISSGYSNGQDKRGYRMK